MRSQKTLQGIALSAAGAAAVLLLAGCGLGQPQSQTTTTEPAGSGSGTTGSASPSQSAPATSAAPPSSAAPSTQAPAGPGLCKAGSLSAATDASGGGAAGSVYMKLNLTNTGGEPCILRGFAGVSLAAGADGGPIGAAAARDESVAVTDVLLAPGQTDWAQLRYTQAGNYMDCSPVDAAGYRIYPPEDTASLFLPQPTTACSNADIKLLTIGAFQPA